MGAIGAACCGFLGAVLVLVSAANLLTTGNTDWAFLVVGVGFLVLALFTMRSYRVLADVTDQAERAGPVIFSRRLGVTVVLCIVVLVAAKLLRG